MKTILTDETYARKGIETIFHGFRFHSFRDETYARKGIETSCNACYGRFQQMRLTPGRALKPQS